MVALHHNYFARSSARRAYQGLEPSLYRQPGLCMGFGGNRAAGDARRGIYSREPARSLHWALEQRMWQSGRWRDKTYSACAGWSSSQIAAPAPPGQDRRLAPHGLPASTRAMSIQPRCALLHRMPTVECVGRREDWLLLDPRAMREWAMAPVALSLGLRLRGAQAQGLPVRAQAQAVLGKRKFLPDAHIYVGMGHHSHRLACSKWAANKIPGIHCGGDDWLPHYVAHIHQSGLFGQLEELEGMTLVCDCAMEVPCEADVLIGLLFERRLQSGEPGRGSGSVSRRRPRRAALAAWGGIPGAQALPRNLQKHSQESCDSVPTTIFYEWLQHTTFPMIEDLVNSFPFSAFTEWCEDQELDVDGRMGPVLATCTARFRQITATGRQAGALSHKAALPPLQAGEPTPDEHFDHAWDRRQDRTPLEEEPMLDVDLRFAAACCARWRGQMIDLWRQAVGALRELKQRWQGVTAALRERQPAAIGRVTAQRDVGFTALLIILSSWPDVSYPYGLVCGLPAVGYAPPCGIFPEQEARRIPFEEVVMGAEANNQRILATLRSGKDDVFLLSQSTLDADRGFCMASNV